MAQVAFPKLTEVESAFHDLVWKALVKAGETALETEVPALDLPVLKQIEEGVIDLVTEAVFRQIVLLIDIGSIRLVNAEHQKAFDEAVAKLKIISREKGPNSPEYQKERELAEAAFANFVRYGAAV